jgi:hypothetical protein
LLIVGHAEISPAQGIFSLIESILNQGALLNGAMDD